MSLIQNNQYKELCLQMNPYIAILQMAKDTRNICISLDNRITVSDALSYAANGTLPDPKDYPDHRLDRVKDYLTGVTDREIKSAVLFSYEQSLYKNNLVYEYKNVEDVPRQARIRIIMNILWDNRPHKDK